MFVGDGKTHVLGQSNLNELHWTPLQQLTHLASAGEGLATGDIFGTGTISSPVSATPKFNYLLLLTFILQRTNDAGEKIGLGCIFERKAEGNILSAFSDIQETFLQDGDEVVLEGWAIDGTGKTLFGFGESRGQVLPAIAS